MTDNANPSPKGTCDSGSCGTCYCGCASVSCRLASDSYYDYCEDKISLEIHWRSEVRTRFNTKIKSNSNMKKNNLMLPPGLCRMCVSYLEV